MTRTVCSEIGFRLEHFYYGLKGKFSRFTLVGGIVNQAISVSTHFTMNTHDSLISTIWYAVPLPR
jgi:hypothetical protein